MTITRLSSLVVLLLCLSERACAQSVESVAEETSIQWPSCSIVAQPKPSNVTHSPFFGNFLEAYTETVDTIVGLQTTTWNYIERYHHFDESKVEGLCEAMNNAHLRTNVPKFAKKLEEESTNETHNTTIAKAWEVPSDFKNDKESDIEGYFAKIAEACMKDIEDEVAADEYAVECLDRIKNTVYEPRCTTRYDSRVTCDGETIPSELSTPSELIEDHFGSSNQDELHVVIVGAGPVGLMLGNALSVLQKKNIDIPPIKILYLEARADAPGVKKPYTRNWQAHLSLLHFRDRMDPRLMKIIGSMTVVKDEPETSTLGFVFPLNVIETLLMLSNRDLGAAKFLWGVNPLDVVEDLKKVPNLVVVDTTGHRLDPLARVPACDSERVESACPLEEQTVEYNYRTPGEPDIPWYNDDNEDFYENLATFSQDFTPYHDMVEEHGQTLTVGRRGDLMYPIDEKTKAAKSMWWLDVHGAMPLNNNMYMMERNQDSDALYAGEGPFCAWCKDWLEDHADENLDFGNEEEMKTHYICNTQCYSSFWAQSTKLFRPDINYNIFNGWFDGTFVFHSDSWFPINGYSFNPSPEMAETADKVLEINGFGHHPIGMPLKDFYPALMSFLGEDEWDDDDGYDDDEYYDEDGFDENGLSESDWALIEALERYAAQSGASEWPKVTLFAQQPFIYTNGIRKQNKCLGTASTHIGDHLDHAATIRFGDSFTTGDGLSKYNSFFLFLVLLLCRERN